MGVGFLTAAEIKQRRENLFRGEVDEERAEGASYDLSLGEEIYLSGQEYPEILSDDKPFITIPRGQFALLMTKEYVIMPRRYLGFISIKFSIKKQGLINISGFHVDPGREGKIIFSVFNAGPNDVVLKYRDPVFMIFFFQLANEAEPYKGSFNNTGHLPADLVTSLKGTSASLSDVDKRVSNLEVRDKIFFGLLAALATGLVALFVQAIASRPTG